MVQNHLSDKQKEVKAELESNKAMENIYVFKSSTSLVNDMQVGNRDLLLQGMLNQIKI